jgi:hypothetical protein
MKKTASRVVDDRKSCGTASCGTVARAARAKAYTRSIVAGTVALLSTAAMVAACGGTKTDPRYPPRPEGCAVQVFRGKVAGIAYDDIGHVDSICGNDIGPEGCLAELKNQTCKLGGDIVYDVPDEPNKPSPDKISYTGRVAHTRASATTPAPSPSK